jgi:DNA-damage-inducible protein J
MKRRYFFSWLNEMTGRGESLRLLLFSPAVLASPLLLRYIEIHCVSIFKKRCRMAATAMVHVRVNENIKTQAAETLAAMGLSVSDAVRVFLTRIAVEKELPFTLRVPNAETLAAMNEADEIAKTRRARFSSAEELFASLEKDCGR